MPQHTEGEGGREREREHTPFGCSFYMFFSFPLGLPYANSAQAGALFYLKSSLWSSDLPLFYFHGLYPSLSFTLPPFWTAFPYSHHLTHPFLVDSGGSLEAKSYPTLGIPLSVAHQAPLSMGFFRQEYWSGLPFPSPGESSRPRN